MQLANHQQLDHLFVESYIDQEHILFKKDHQKKFCQTFLEFITKFYHTISESCSIQEEIVLKKNEY